MSVIINSDEQYIERSTTFPQVSWIRRRDWHIMSVGETVFTTDDRVQVLFQPGSTRVHNEKIYTYVVRTVLDDMYVKMVGDPPSSTI